MTLLTAMVEDLAHDGAGVAKVDGLVYFIDGAVPGEWVEFEPRKKQRGRLPGVLRRVVAPPVATSPSPPATLRTTPRCEYFGVCGGCALQHIAAAAQVAFKEKMLFDALERIARTEPDERVAPLSAAPWRYRRKARPGLREVPKKGGLLLGFRERRGGYITALRHCDTLVDPLSALLVPLREVLARVSCRHALPQVEMAAADNAVALVLRHLAPLTGEDTAHLTRFAEDAAVQFWLQPGGPATVAALWPPSPPPLHYRLAEYDLTLRFTATDFIQVNAAVNALMVARALEWLAPTRGEAVLDLFCGIGNFTLPIARSGAAVLGVEADPGVVARAADNARLNGLANAEFMALDLYHADLTPPPDAQRFGKMLLDPPRSGAAEVVARLIPVIRPRVVVYVSCNPATLARDAAVLTQTHGYRLTHAGVVDMFPHTAQVESMARFELAG